MNACLKELPTELIVCIIQSDSQSNTLLTLNSEESHLHYLIGYSLSYLCASLFFLCLKQTCK